MASSIKLAIIIIVYNPDSSNLVKKIEQITDYCIVIVDNSEYASITQNLPQNVTYIPLMKNKGIAYAQNVGIDIANKKGFDYVLFFDQDSDYDNTVVSKLLTDFFVLQKIDDSLGAMGPAVLEKGNSLMYDHRLEAEDAGFVKTDRIISSGMMASCPLLKRIGGMKEELFIDYVDSELCWRLQSKGYSIYVDKNIKLYHSIGNRKIHIGPVSFIFSAPIRYYYQYRNFIFLCFMHYVPLVWKVKNAIRKLFEFFFIPFAMRNITCLKYMVKGIKDGLFKKTGCYE